MWHKVKVKMVGSGYTYVHENKDKKIYYHRQSLLGGTQVFEEDLNPSHLSATGKYSLAGEEREGNSLLGAKGFWHNFIPDKYKH